MKRWSAPLLLTIFPVLGWSEEGVRLPDSSTGTVTRDRTHTTVHYPFGRVEVPHSSTAKGKSVVAPPGKLHARTKGAFKLSYELARNGDHIVARKVMVRVKNREEYLSEPTLKLREHEAMHARINEAEAIRIEEELSAFKTRELDPVIAKKEFKSAFQNHMESVKSLHKEWDENHIFEK